MELCLGIGTLPGPPTDTLSNHASSGGMMAGWWPGEM